MGISILDHRRSKGQGFASPHCPSCGRRCEPGITWKGSNYCRGLILLRHIEDEPGRSGWELAQAAGLGYPEVARALGELRKSGVVVMERGDGYWPVGDAAARAFFVAAVRQVEALNDESRSAWSGFEFRLPA